MATTFPAPDFDTVQPERSWFTRPLSPWWLLVGLVLASGVFIGLIQLLGGPAGGDAFESIYSAWAVAHAHLACLYPPRTGQPTDYAAPVYPLVTGGLNALTHIGKNAPFPSLIASHGCVNAVNEEIVWALLGGALLPTLKLGYVSWFFVMGGTAYILRATNRGGTGWEPTALVTMAVLPPVWMCIEFFYHPQDLMAMGLALTAMGCALRRQWGAAGVLIAVAVFTHQFALLVALPLLVIAPAEKRIRYLVSALVTTLIIVAPLLVFAGIGTAKEIFFGTGNSPGQGGTVFWEFHLHGVLLVLISRILPLILSFLLAVYAVRKVGRAVLEPQILLALIAVSLSLRLVLEQNIFGYYYMALAVSLLLLDVIRGRIRESLIAWLAMILLAYSEGPIALIMWRQHWGQDARHWIPAIIMIVALLYIVRRVTQHRVNSSLLIWAGLVVGALIMWPISSDPFHRQPATWFWQVILVTIGVILAAGPLRSMMGERSAPSDEALGARDDEGRLEETGREGAPEVSSLADGGGTHD